MSVWGRVLVETQHFTWMMVQVWVLEPVQSKWLSARFPTSTFWLNQWHQVPSSVALAGTTIVCQARHPSEIPRTPLATIWGLQVCRTKLQRWNSVSMELVSFKSARQGILVAVHQKAALLPALLPALWAISEFNFLALSEWHLIG